MTKKLEASLKKVDQVFEKMFTKGISHKKKKENGSTRWSERTKKTYRDMMRAFVREYHIQFGVSDISRMTDSEKIEQLIQNRIDKYHAGETKESYNLKTLVAAIKAFNLGVQETNVFKNKRKFEIGNPEKIRKFLKEQYVIRRSGFSQNLRATPAQAQEVLDNIMGSGYAVETRQLAFHVGRISLETGGRITSILKLRAGDFVIEKGKNEIVFQKDKGGLTRRIAISKDTAAYLQQLKANKKENQRVFTSKRADGSFKSVQEIRKEITKIISKAGKHLEREEKLKMRDQNGEIQEVDVKRKFTPHSFRKAFAVNRTAYYINIFKNDKNLKKYIASRVLVNPSLKGKLENVKDRINGVHDNKRKVKGKRGLTAGEYAIFFTSVDLGHFRNDVITQFYTTFKEVKAYLCESEADR